MSKMADGGSQSRNVYIVGAQCTGETTLVNEIEAELALSPSAEDGPRTSRPVVIREGARTVLKEKQFSREDITTSPTRALLLQHHILDAQLSAEQAASGSADPTVWYICDRSGLDPITHGGKETT